MTNESEIMPRIAVIMAGGSGERFWPLSREHKPKQLLCLTHPEKTMLEEAIDRIAKIMPRENIYVQTMPHLLEPIKHAELSIPQENVIAEPCKRNTAGCLCYAAAFLRAKYSSEVNMAILTADHAIEEEDLFVECIDNALSLAQSKHTLVTLGIKPTRPETGYGYIQVESHDASGAYPVKSFKEKPSVQSAERYLAEGNY